MMKTLKTAIVTAALASVGMAAMPAQARPHHRQRVCHTERYHHQIVQRCHYR